MTKRPTVARSDRPSTTFKNPASLRSTLVPSGPLFLFDTTKPPQQATTPSSVVLPSAEREQSPSQESFREATNTDSTPRTFKTPLPIQETNPRAEPTAVEEEATQWSTPPTELLSSRKRSKNNRQAPSLWQICRGKHAQARQPSISALSVVAATREKKRDYASEDSPARTAVKSR